MKKILTVTFLAAAALALMSGLSSCNKNIDGTETDLRLIADKTIIAPDGKDAATFTVEHSGTDVTASAVIFNADGTPATLTDMKFVTDKEGSYEFYAMYNGTTSQSVTVVATYSVPDVPADPSPESTDFAKRVLLLQFTGTDCSACPFAKLAFRDLSQSSVRDQFVQVAVHSRTATDPAYYGGYLRRVAGVTGEPYVVADMDPSIYSEGASAATSSTVAQYRQLIANSTTKHPAKASVAAASSLQGSNVLVNVSVKVAQRGSYSVAAWLLEDGIYGEQNNGGATGMDFNTHNDCLRYAQYTGIGSNADYSGTSVGILLPGEEAAVTFTIPVQSGWKAENCHLVVLVTEKVNNVVYAVNAAPCPVEGTVAYSYNN